METNQNLSNEECQEKTFTLSDVENIKQGELTVNQYAAIAHSTSLHNMPIIYPTLGLTGESGEVADKVKKVIRDNNNQFDEDKRHGIALELGDVCWYAAELAHDLGYSLEEIMRMNLEKVLLRKKNNTTHGSGDYR